MAGASSEPISFHFAIIPPDQRCAPLYPQSVEPCTPRVASNPSIYLSIDYSFV
ncbi:hypothetical protein L218DRAFT_960679 [Marasmius fiardii PR-910]|nr:hypothetical protein L218DRAFT_960679 [Marasmius fiardii PR-910]